MSAVSATAWLHHPDLPHGIQQQHFQVQDRGLPLLILNKTEEDTAQMFYAVDDFIENLASDVFKMAFDLFLKRG